MVNKHGVRIIDGKFSRLEIMLMKEKEPSMPMPKAKEDNPVVYSTGKYTKTHYPTSLEYAFKRANYDTSKRR